MLVTDAAELGLAKADMNVMGKVSFDRKRNYVLKTEEDGSYWFLKTLADAKKG